MTKVVIVNKNEVKKLILTAIKNECGDSIGVFLFGSRAKDTFQSFSDYDIGLIGGGIDHKKLSKLRDHLSESNIPFNVDLVDMNKADLSFKKIAMEHIEIWQNSNLVQSHKKNLTS